MVMIACLPKNMVFLGIVRSEMMNQEDRNEEPEDAGDTRSGFPEVKLGYILTTIV